MFLNAYHRRCCDFEPALKEQGEEGGNGRAMLLIERIAALSAALSVRQRGRPNNAAVKVS